MFYDTDSLGHSYPRPTLPIMPIYMERGMSILGYPWGRIGTEFKMRGIKIKRYCVYFAFTTGLKKEML